MLCYKLFKLRQDGTLGSLYHDCKARLPVGKWLKAKCHPAKQLALRQGWHATLVPHAPHLSLKGRVWCAVEVKDFELLKRPAGQGEVWVIAQRMKIVKVMHDR